MAPLLTTHCEPSVELHSVKFAIGFAVIVEIEPANELVSATKIRMSMNFINRTYYDAEITVFKIREPEKILFT